MGTATKKKTIKSHYNIFGLLRTGVTASCKPKLKNIALAEEAFLSKKALWLVTPQTKRNCLKFLGRKVSPTTKESYRKDLLKYKVTKTSAINSTLPNHSKQQKKFTTISLVPSRAKRYSLIPLKMKSLKEATVQTLKLPSCQWLQLLELSDDIFFMMKSSLHIIYTPALVSTSSKPTLPGTDSLSTPRPPQTQSKGYQSATGRFGRPGLRISRSETFLSAICSGKMSLWHYHPW